jgi:hypothetical protein
MCAVPKPRFTPRARHRDQSALAAMFTSRASSVTLKKKDATPWAATVRRIALDVTATSDTCDVMPMTKEK